MSLEVDVTENYHKDMPIYSNCLVSETIRTIPEGTTMISPSTTRRYLRERCLFGRAAVKKLFIRQKKTGKGVKRLSKNIKIGPVMTGTRFYGLMNRSLMNRLMNRSFMCGDAQVSGSLTTAFPLQSNMEVEI